MKSNIYEYGNGGPVILWGTYSHRASETKDVIKTIENELKGEAYVLIVYEVEDWNGLFSPWTSEKLDVSFRGEGRYTLEWIKGYIDEYVRKQYEGREIYLMGYSLAGLFSLWGIFNIEIDGVIGGSSSLWYPKFVQYVKERADKINGKNIYLSIGGKEANTKDELMSTVMVCSKSVVECLRDGNRVNFEVNKGGHFADVGKRLAKGIRWILKC